MIAGHYLEGRSAIITAGFSAIGKAIAMEHAQRGATIAVGERRLPGRLVITMEAIQLNAGALW